jgi:hypothetical protein
MFDEHCPKAPARTLERRARTPAMLNIRTTDDPSVRFAYKRLAVVLFDLLLDDNWWATYCWFLGARIVQSIIHLISTSSIAVSLRFAAFAVQMVIGVYWALKLLFI